MQVCCVCLVCGCCFKLKGVLLVVKVLFGMCCGDTGLLLGCEECGAGVVNEACSCV